MAGFLAKPQSNHTNSLSRRLEASDGVIYLTENVVEDVGYMVIEPDTSNQEIIKYTSKAAGYVSGGIRQLSTVGSAETAGTGIAHPAGATVEMRDVHYYFARVIDALNGVSSISANRFGIGENVATASAITAGMKGVFYVAGTSASLSTFGIGLSSNGYGVWTDDSGSSWNRLSATGGAIATGDGWENAAGVGNVKPEDLISATAGISSINDNFSVNEAWSPTWSGNHTFNGTTLELSTTNINIRGTKLSAAASDINQITTGISAYSTVTPYNLSGVTGSGTTSLHYHYFAAGLSSRDAGSTGTQDITFAGFTPRLLIVNFHSFTGIGRAGNWGTGYATGAAAEGCSRSYSDGTTLIADVEQNNTNIITMRDPAATGVVLANVTGWAAGAITLNWTANTSAGATRYYTYQVYG